MPVPITALYAGLLALWSGVLSLQVGLARNRKNISILYDDDMELAEKIRRHANFTEYVPLALVLIVCLELNGASAGVLHGLGGVLLVARILHPFGVHHATMSHPLRAAGAAGTTLVTVVAALLAIWGFVSG